MYVFVQGEVLTGTADMFGNYVVPTISDAPSGTSIEYVNIIRFCCTKSLWTLDSANPVKISTSRSTPVGTYPLTIVYTTAGGLQHSTTYTIFVDPQPTLAPWGWGSHSAPPMVA